MLYVYVHVLCACVYYMHVCAVCICVLYADMYVCYMHTCAICIRMCYVYICVLYVYAHVCIICICVLCYGHMYMCRSVHLCLHLQGVQRRTLSLLLYHSLPYSLKPVSHQT